MTLEDFEGYAAMWAEPEVMRFLSVDGKPLSRFAAWQSFSAQMGHWQLRGFGMFTMSNEPAETSLAALGHGNRKAGRALRSAGRFARNIGVAVTPPKARNVPETCVYRTEAGPHH